MFHNKSFPAQRVSQSPGKFRVIFDEQNANGLPPSGQIPPEPRDRQAHAVQLAFSLAAASRQFDMRE
jgi:hypothetical protein